MSVITTDKNKPGYKNTLFNKIRQYNIQIVDNIFFFKDRTRQIKATEPNKVNYLS